jgi:hypothetical protein
LKNLENVVLHNDFSSIVSTIANTVEPIIQPEMIVTKRMLHDFYPRPYVSIFELKNNLKISLNKYFVSPDLDQSKKDCFTKINSNCKFVAHSNFDESLRWIKRGFGNKAPIRILKVPVIDQTDILFKSRFNTEKGALIHKNVTYAPYLVIKQKRYTLKKKILEKNFKIHANSNVNTVLKSNFFIDNNVGSNTIDNMSKIYKFLKKNKKRDEMFSIVTSRRLLRTRHTLVLPAHVNITAITNSYDVVHS